MKIGDRVGRLVIVEPRLMYGSRKAWLCHCDCGCVKVVVDYSLKREVVHSCGCYAREVSSTPMSNEEKTKLSMTRKRLYAEGLLVVSPVFLDAVRRGRVQSQKEKDKRASSNRGKKRSPEQRERISRGVSKAMNDPVVREKCRQAALRSWANPEVAAKQVAAILAATSVHPNGLERRVMELLERYWPDEWQFVGDGSLILGKMCPDFVHKTNNLLIEAFGRYWHEEEDDAIRSAYLADRGYKTLVVWGDDMDEVMLGKIRRFIKEDAFAAGER